MKPKDVDTYIANSDKAAHRVLKELRRIIRSTIPKAEESISWNVPFYKYHGALAGFAVCKTHISFGIAAGVFDKKDRDLLESKGYTTGLRTIQIRFDQKVPGAQIKQILKEKAKMNEQKKAIH